jgi:hypothetical protein
MLETERPLGEWHRGHAQLNARRLREFSLLREIRGSFAEGCRNRALLIYAWLLRCSRMSPEAILREGHSMGAEWRPPLSVGEIRQAVKTATGRKFTRLRDQTISDWLDITPPERECLEKLPASTRFGRKARVVPESSRRVEGKAAILQIVQEGGGSVLQGDGPTPEGAANRGLAYASFTRLQNHPYRLSFVTEPTELKLSDCYILCWRRW